MEEFASTSKNTASLPDGLDTPRRYWAVAGLMTALTVSALDATMANVALPTIAHDLNIDPGAVMWVVIAYSLTVVVALLPLSAVADRIGFRRMFAIGMTVFMLASLANALSTSLFMLTAGRIAQGLGAAMLMCLFGGLVRNIYPIRKLGMGISINATLVGFMSVLGPSLGAFILDIGSWQWIFALNIPVCLVAYFFIRYLPNGPRHSARFDWTACCLSMLFFGTSVVGLDAVARHPGIAAACLIVACLTAVLLVRRSRNQTAPLVPIDLLKLKPVGFAILASLCVFAAQMAAFVALPFYFLRVLGHDYIEVGILLGAWSIGVAIMAPIAGYMSGKFKVAILCAIGAVCMTLGLICVVLLPVQADFMWMVATMILGGIGFGFFQTPNNRAILSGAPRTRSGAAGGLQATTRVFGQSIGTALVALAFNASPAYGSTLGIVVAAVCALAALGINIARYYSPTPDLEL